jgi:hypothetical protein
MFVLFLLKMLIYLTLVRGVRSAGKPRKRWEDVVQQDAACYGVAIGSWPLITEHSGGGRWRTSIPDLGCSANGLMELYGICITIYSHMRAANVYIGHWPAIYFLMLQWPSLNIK